MRISVFEGDPGFALFTAKEPYIHHMAVFVNGDPIYYPLTVDLGLGEVLCYSRDLDGKMISTGNGYAMTRLRGDIRVIIPNALPPVRMQ